MDGETWKANVLKDVLANQNDLFLFSFVCVNFIFLNQLLYKGCLKQFNEKCLSSKRSGSLLSFISVMKFSISWIDLNHKKMALSQCFLCSLDYIKVWLNIFSIFTMLQCLGIQEKLLELLQIIFWKPFHSHHSVSVNIFSLDKLFKTSRKHPLKIFCSLDASFWPSVGMGELKNDPIFSCIQDFIQSLGLLEELSFPPVLPAKLGTAITMIEKKFLFLMLRSLQELFRQSLMHTDEVKTKWHRQRVPEES